MPEEHLINKLKKLNKELKDLDTLIAANERKLLRTQRGDQSNVAKLKKESEDLKTKKNEIENEISHIQKLVRLQGATETKERKIQALKNEIKEFRKKTNQQIGELDKDIRDLRQKSDELQGKITQLKSEIQDLKKKIEEKDNRVFLLENEMKENEINYKNKIKDITSKYDDEIKDLRYQTMTKIEQQEDGHSKKMDEVFYSNNFLEEEVEKLKTENSKIKNDIDKLKKFESPGNCADENKNILYIGQVCSDLQSNWYRYVMPEHYYDNRRNYKVKDIEEDIEDLLSEEEQIDAKGRWEVLQHQIDWKKNKRLLGAIKRLQYKRNQAAHPTLTVEGARKAAEELEKQGELKVKPTTKDVQKVIELWVSSRSL